jgi:two-component system cell cycle sensor histidine kinase/response regulator CckA
LDGAQPYFTLEYASGPAAEKRWYTMHATALVGRRGVVVAHEEITERKRAEIALRENHSLLHAVTEGTTDMVFVKDLEGRYLLINSAGARLLGKSVEEVLHRNDLALLEPESAERIMSHDRDTLVSGMLQTYEETLTVAGVTRTFSTTKGPYYDYRGKIIGLIGISHDITARKQLEAQYSAAQRMESVGRLAGGIAHDFNNLLTAIGGYAEMSIETLPPDHPAHNDLSELRNTVRRAANLTRQLLAFARRQIVEPQTFSLNDLVADLDKLLRHVIGEDIELITRFEPNLGQVRADPGQIEQVVINLIVNSRDAMPNGGTIVVETSHATLDHDYARQHPSVVPGEYVVLTISDTGVGMADEVKQHVFEPFFTTKGAGHGTGLGLATCYGIVKQSGGNIWIYSELGIGTAVKVYLPRVEAMAQALPARDTAEHPGAPQGSETILLVEDEAAVRSVALRALQAQGYRVLEAANGAEALSIAREQANGEIQLLLTDVIMPKIDGKALADAIQALYPNIRVLFISGYTDSMIVQRGLLFPRFELLQKPFSPGQLAQKVRRILDANSSG